MSQAEVFYGIACCVAHLYFLIFMERINYHAFFGCFNFKLCNSCTLYYIS